MKPTSLSPEFYTNLYKQICETNINDADMSDDFCSVYLDIDDVDGCYVCLKATFRVYVAYGTDSDWEYTKGELTDIEEVQMWDQDDNRADELFDYDAFWSQLN